MGINKNKQHIHTHCKAQFPGISDSVGLEWGPKHLHFEQTPSCCWCQCRDHTLRTTGLGWSDDDSHRLLIANELNLYIWLVSFLNIQPTAIIQVLYCRNDLINHFPTKITWQEGCNAKKMFASGCICHCNSARWLMWNLKTLHRFLSIYLKN